MPADTNANGDIFGGWLLSQMDVGGGVFAVGAVGVESINGLILKRRELGSRHWH